MTLQWNDNMTQKTICNIAMKQWWDSEAFCKRLLWSNEYVREFLLILLKSNDVTQKLTICIMKKSNVAPKITFNNIVKTTA